MTATELIALAALGGLIALVGFSAAIPMAIKRRWRWALGMSLAMLAGLSLSAGCGIALIAKGALFAKAQVEEVVASVEAAAKAAEARRQGPKKIVQETNIHG